MKTKRTKKRYLNKIKHASSGGARSKMERGPIYWNVNKDIHNLYIMANYLATEHRAKIPAVAATTNLMWTSRIWLGQRGAVALYGPNVTPPLHTSKSIIKIQSKQRKLTNYQQVALGQMDTLACNARNPYQSDLYASTKTWNQESTKKIKLKKTNNKKETWK